MRKSLTIFAAGLLLFFPFAAGAADYGSSEAQTGDMPPVAQALVREGDFAVKLAARYDLGAPANETEAEDLLASAGVVPLNGWISDYPVTPEILGQLQEAAVKAASEGKLSMTAEEATRRLYELASKMSLPVPAGPESKAAGEPQAPQQPVINNYYAGYGPPIITYYPPPPSYLYLYAWVPYPVWWYGYWYPGFYICHNFTTTVVFESRTVFVRNRYVDPVTRRVVRVDPVVRTARDTVRPVTTLRTEDGRTFTTIREMRQGTASGRAAERGGTLASRPPGAGGFRSLEDRRSARDIYTRSIERRGTVGQGGRSGGSVLRGNEQRRSPQGIGGGSYTAPPQSDQRSYERRSGGGERGEGTPRRSGRSYDDEERGQSRRFQGSSPGGGGYSVTPAPPVNPFTPPRIEQQYRDRPDQRREMRPVAPGSSSVNSPKPSQKSFNDEDMGSGRNTRQPFSGRGWGGR
jgi:hypothetical protein